MKMRVQLKANKMTEISAEFGRTLIRFVLATGE
jgi:hypothetical protein